MAERPLEGLRVVEAATLAAGPMVGAALGDRVLEHLGGPPERHRGPRLVARDIDAAQLGAVHPLQHHDVAAGIERLPREQGIRRDIDDNGDLLIRRMGKAEVTRKKFLRRIAEPAWFDPQARGPRA